MGEFEAASERIATYPDVPEKWTSAFDTLREAIAREMTEQVGIGKLSDREDEDEE